MEIKLGERIKKFWEWVKKNAHYIIAAVGIVIGGILGFLGISKRNRSETGHIGDTIKSVETGVGDSTAAAKKLDSTIDSVADGLKDSTATVAGATASIERAATATSNAQDTINDIRKLIEIERQRNNESTKEE